MQRSAERYKEQLENQHRFINFDKAEIRSDSNLSQETPIYVRAHVVPGYFRRLPNLTYYSTTQQKKFRRQEK